MKQNGFRVTYDIVTEESAANGDTAENGFILSGNWKVPIDIALADTDGDYTMSLRAALSLTGSSLEDCGRWFAMSDPFQDYGTGETESRSLHPPDTISRASYRRLARLVDGRHILTGAKHKRY